jgi:dephospho-CoA kinase
MGGIGSGKSTVTSMFVENGAAALSADEIAHDVIQLPEIREEIRSWMGDEVVGQDGRVDRNAVARRVFSNPGDPSELRRLETLLHPEIRRRISARIEAFRALPGSRGQVLVLDVPLLAGSPFEKVCDAIVYVDAPAEERRRRTARRGWDETEFERRETQQKPTEQKKEIADLYLDNSGLLEKTRTQVRALYEKLTESEATNGAAKKTREGARTGEGNTREAKEIARRDDQRRDVVPNVKESP